MMSKLSYTSKSLMQLFRDHKCQIILLMIKIKKDQGRLMLKKRKRKFYRILFKYFINFIFIIISKFNIIIKINAFYNFQFYLIVYFDVYLIKF
jgi:hypothetical protein